MTPTAVTVDAYVAGFPEATQQVLRELRRRVLTQLPEAAERISYDIPTFTIDGQYVIYIAGWSKHVSVYPIPEGDPELDADLAPYVSGRGTVKLPLNRPIPWDLVDRAIARQVATRVSELRR